MSTTKLLICNYFHGWQRTAGAAVFAMAISLVLEASIFGQHQDVNWGTKMINVSQIDFGTVAKGSETFGQVRVKNIYKEDIQITDVSHPMFSTWKEEQTNQLPITIPSGKEYQLTLRIDTIRHHGPKKGMASITLLDKVHQNSVVVSLPVQGMIRGDVVAIPEALNFGTVDIGNESVQKIRIKYAGRKDWKINEVKSPNPNVTAAFREISREAVSAQTMIQYEITATLISRGPVGAWREKLTIVTDDLTNSKIPINFEAEIKE